MTAAQPPAVPGQKGGQNIYLTGFSGTGKSHSGRLAAQSLGMEFVDTDDLIERQAGKPITRIFAEDGEARFRVYEAEALSEIASSGGRVVATGGGMPISAENRELMANTGLVIRLRASPETIHARVNWSNAARGRALRPLLGGDAPVEKIRQLLSERESAYATADVTLDTEGKLPGDVAQEIAQAWRRHTGVSADRTP
jgi:shikimate kinase